MQISAAMVKELRERTGAGMMECKKALSEANGDMEAAIEAMRKSGQAKAVKKSSRVAAEGQIVVSMSDDGSRAAIVEVNCETDFVGKDENFKGFAQDVAALVLKQAPADVNALMALPSAHGASLDEARAELISKVGENVQVRRFDVLNAQAGQLLMHYLHGSRIGVLVHLQGGNADLAKDLAMHIAACRPVCLDESGVPVELLNKERDIFKAQAEESGKPAEIVEKMVEGRIRKYLAEITLLGQAFVKDQDKTVAALVKDANAQVLSFVRYEVGEGIEKKTENFAEEVMAQAKNV
ncbi:translation elongation factor Ts [Thiorhodospira sibirica]|uniref:translation elongation factor Ts n=1 Tax=Thiorhodospira sibirica TaxID=154347 RepID=UPI00022C33CE|nr:translation elongation factor Ts [Thiorhodospira sibirica]